MLEVIVERWADFGGTVDYRWSVWKDGKRVEMGGPHGDPQASETEAVAFCRRMLGTPPDRVTHL